jgi:hypothetical protein
MAPRHQRFGRLPRKRCHPEYRSAHAQCGQRSREGSSKFSSSTISGNAGAGVALSDLSMVDFNGSTVARNHGGIDVVCNPQFPAMRGTKTDINGGTTNCIEP